MQNPPRSVPINRREMLGLSLATSLATSTALVMHAEVKAERQAEDGFVRLFDGQTLNGWHGDKKIFRVEEGQIVGGNLKDRVERNEFLRTNEQYEDFE